MPDFGPFGPSPNRYATENEAEMEGWIRVFGIGVVVVEVNNDYAFLQNRK